MSYAKVSFQGKGPQARPLRGAASVMRGKAKSGSGTRHTTELDKIKTFVQARPVTALTTAMST